MKATKLFLKELKSSLPKSSYEQRKKWATFILEQNIDLKELAELLSVKKK